MDTPTTPMGTVASPGAAKVSDVALSYVRTWTPYLVATVLAFLGTRYHIVIPDGVSPQIVGFLVFGAGSLYYALARWAERREGHGKADAAMRWLGRWMLGGVVRQPVYTKPPTDRSIVIEPTGAVRHPE